MNQLRPPQKSAPAEPKSKTIADKVAREQAAAVEIGRQRTIRSQLLNCRSLVYEELSQQSAFGVAIACNYFDEPSSPHLVLTFRTDRVAYQKQGYNELKIEGADPIVRYYTVAILFTQDPDTHEITIAFHAHEALGKMHPNNQIFPPQAHLIHTIIHKPNDSALRRKIKAFVDSIVGPLQKTPDVFVQAATRDWGWPTWVAALCSKPPATPPKQTPYERWSAPQRG